LLSNYSVEYFYDNFSRVASKKVSFNTNTTSNVYSLAYSYYPSSDKVSSLTYPKNLTIFYCYNSYDYLSSISVDDSTCLQNFLWRADAYNGADILQQETFGNNITQLYTYDQTSFLLTDIRSVYRQTNALLRHWQYAYDLKRNLISRSYFDSANSALALNETFTYDTLNRINSSYSLYYSGSNRSLEANVWQYDSIGNIASLGNMIYYFDMNKPQQAIQIGDKSVSYDSLGNVVSTSAYSIEWNSFVRVKTLFKNRTVTKYEYGFEDLKIAELITRKGQSSNLANFQQTYYIDDV
jgi:hypothetical protein